MTHIIRLPRVRFLRCEQCQRLRGHNQLRLGKRTARGAEIVSLLECRTCGSRHEDAAHPRCPAMTQRSLFQ